MTKFAMPRRKFQNGKVHYLGPSQNTKYYVGPATLCGSQATYNLIQGRIKEPINCERCAELADWVWKHRRGYGYGETRKPQSGD